VSGDLLTDDYKVVLEVFEGPLDLLLYLIRKEEVDIYDIPIGRITDQYMEYLKLMKVLDLGIAGDFIVMAASLMLIKSRMLLPQEERTEEEEEEDDPRWDLVRQLVEYKKFKDAASHLEALETQMENVFGREGGHVELGEPPDLILQDASLFDLIASLNEILGRVKEESLQEIFAEEYTVTQKIESIVEILQHEKQLSITELFRGMHSRQEIICTFLAVLELIKLHRISAVQKGRFGAIMVQRTEMESPPISA
jgi:segregation and condensation protein A